MILSPVTLYSRLASFLPATWYIYICLLDSFPAWKCLSASVYTSAESHLCHWSAKLGAGWHSCVFSHRIENYIFNLINQNLSNFSLNHNFGFQSLFPTNFGKGQWFLLPLSVLWAVYCGDDHQNFFWKVCYSPNFLHNTNKYVYIFFQQRPLGENIYVK